MKNVVGQTPRGKDFYKRPKLIEKFYRRLESGSNLYMAAPRRVGKTSIMRFLEDQPREGFEFVYVFVEAIDDPEEFFQELFIKLLRSNAISAASKRLEQSKTFGKSILGRIKSITILGQGIELNDGEKITFHEALENLVSKLEPVDKKIVIMIDEFPQVIENISEKQGNEVAEKFLRTNRGLRQSANQNIQFIYTGSIGLPVVVKKFSSLAVINDLNIIEVPPLSEKEALDFSQKILKEYSLEIEQEVIPHLLQKVEWLIPHFLQLAIQELIDIYESKEKTITPKDVDDAISKMVNLRNNIYFESYFTRLESRFSATEYKFALKILGLIAEQNDLDKSEILTLATKSKVPEKGARVLESLEFDGYITPLDKKYRFTSPILQLWWKKYVSE